MVETTEPRLTDVPPTIGRLRIHAFNYNRFEAEANSFGKVLAAIDGWGNGHFADFRAGLINLAAAATALTVKFSTLFLTTNYTVNLTPEFNLGAVSLGGSFSWQAMLPQ